MENTATETREAAGQVYNYAADLLINRKMETYEVVTALMDQGVDEQTANMIVDNLDAQITKAKRKRASRDMIFGALWCVGGIALTAANIGFIFWGAIVFGGYQMIRGAIAMGN